VFAGGRDALDHGLELATVCSPEGILALDLRDIRHPPSLHRKGVFALPSHAAMMRCAQASVALPGRRVRLSVLALLPVETAMLATSMPAARVVAADVLAVQDRRMADAIKPLEQVLAEADVVIRVRLKEIGLEVPHLVIAATPNGEVVLRSNVSPDVLRSFGEDLKNIADELEAPPAPDDPRH
jgi:hypothetical protein